MPHIIIEHSADIKSSQITNLSLKIQSAMASITEGNFDPDQCKFRSHSFDEYLVGVHTQEKSSFIHITIKILSGRSLLVKKELSEESMATAKSFFADIATSPNEKDQIVALGTGIADAIVGNPHPQALPHNSDLDGKRCDLSVDVVDMEAETYQKFRVKKMVISS